MAKLLQKEIILDRLLLRPFKKADAKDVHKMAGDIAIARTTLDIPHPYENGMAEKWIAGHDKAREAGDELNWAVCLKCDFSLIGAVGLLNINKRHKNGELGYWIGKDYWNNGYCTEAASGVLKYSFEVIELEKVFSRHFASNPSSGRVLAKIKMRNEGTLRKHAERFGKFEDLKCFGILRSEW